MTILDTHVHAWRYPEDFNREVFMTNMPPGMSEERAAETFNLPIEKHLDMMAGAVDKALILGLRAGATLGIDVDNEYLAEQAKKYPGKVYWTCGVTLTDSGAAAEVERCVKELGAVALGELGPGYGHYRIDDPRCFPVYEVARSLDVPLVIHAGPSTPRRLHMKNTDILAVDEVAVNFPELRIAICHMGFPYFEETAFVITKNPNVYGEVSWLPGIAGLNPNSPNPPTVLNPYFMLDYPILYYFSQTFGTRDKLIWGTDVADPRDSLDSVRTINKRLEKQGLPTIPQDAIDRMINETWKQVFTKIPG